MTRKGVADVAAVALRALEPQPRPQTPVAPAPGSAKPVRITLDLDPELYARLKAAAAARPPRKLAPVLRALAEMFLEDDARSPHGHGPV